ncbi:MAG TPA: tRNA lysidine(34) synthetase TilS [Verrucomicrobiae bacterium]|nr:tRNA lysidine(34) synthetase TilS [Verrucomicrobiae bacterium]
MDLWEKVETNIKEHELFERGNILLGVSGGVDSMVLLEVLQVLARKHGWVLQVAHFNHQLRGSESDQDERLVQEVTGRLNLCFAAGHGNVAAVAKATGVSIEMAARQLRHEFIAKTAREIPAPVIALAHHADDQVETFWMRLLRGDVGAGLAGMQWQRASPADPEILLVRPMLDIPKAEILHFAREQGVVFREDSSNAQLQFQRNRFRHEVLPILEAFQPTLRSISLRVAEALGAEKGFLHEQATVRLQHGTPPFDSLHKALQREIIRIQLLKLGIAPNFDLIEQLRRVPETPVSVTPEFAVQRDDVGRLGIVRSGVPDFGAEEKEIELGACGQASFDGLEITWKSMPERGPKAQNTEYFDAKKIGTKIIFRFWRPGDRFQPIGMPIEVKLQDLFSNLKIPAPARRRLVLATSRTGQIFWVEGLRIAEDYKVTPETREVLKWSWRRTPGTKADVEKSQEVP